MDYTTTNTGNPQVNRNWSFPINVAGVAPGGISTGRGINQVPEGYYIVRIEDCYMPANRQDRVLFYMQVLGPDQEYAGSYLKDGINLPKTPDHPVRHFWRSALEAVGYTAQDLDSGQINLNPNLFIGREATVRVVKQDPDSDYINVQFLPPAIWRQQYQEFMAKKKADGNVGAKDNGAAKPAAAAVPAPQPSVSPANFNFQGTAPGGAPGAALGGQGGATMGGQAGATLGGQAPQAQQAQQSGQSNSGITPASSLLEQLRAGG